MITAALQQDILLNTIRITYLPDGYVLFNPTGLFPTTTTTDWQSYWHLLNNDGQLVGSVGAYVIQTPDHIMLVDSGYGPGRFLTSGIVLQGGELLSSLKRADLAPTDIDTVFLTHLHSDHVRGIVRKADDEPILAFPNARFLVCSAEWQRFANPAESRFDIEEALELLEPRIELIEEGDSPVPDITVLATPGHTPGHSSLLISSGDKRAMLLGDTFHSIVQFEHPNWTNSLDHDPELAKITRKHLLSELAKPSTLTIGMHFSNTVFGRVTLAQGKYQWQAQQ